MKKLVSVVTALMMLCASLPFAIASEDEIPEEDVVSLEPAEDLEEESLGNDIPEDVTYTDIAPDLGPSADLIEVLEKNGHAYIAYDYGMKIYSVSDPTEEDAPFVTVTDQLVVTYADYAENGSVHVWFILDGEAVEGYARGSGVIVLEDKDITDYDIQAGSWMDVNDAPVYLFVVTPDEESKGSEADDVVSEDDQFSEENDTGIEDEDNLEASDLVIEPENVEPEHNDIADAGNVAETEDNSDSLDEETVDIVPEVIENLDEDVNELTPSDDEEPELVPEIIDNANEGNDDAISPEEENNPERDSEETSDVEDNSPEADADVSDPVEEPDGAPADPAPEDNEEGLEDVAVPADANDATDASDADPVAEDLSEAEDAEKDDAASDEIIDNEREDMGDAEGDAPGVEEIVDEMEQFSNNEDAEEAKSDPESEVSDDPESENGAPEETPDEVAEESENNEDKTDGDGTAEETSEEEPTPEDEEELDIVPEMELGEIVEGSYIEVYEGSILYNCWGHKMFGVLVENGIMQVERVEEIDGEKCYVVLFWSDYYGGHRVTAYGIIYEQDAHPTFETDLTQIHKEKR